MCHLRQSKHLQKEVKETRIIAECPAEEEKLHPYPSSSPRDSLLKFIHKTQTRIRSICTCVLTRSVVICALTAHSGSVLGLSSPGRWSWSSSDGPLMWLPASGCHWDGSGKRNVTNWRLWEVLINYSYDGSRMQTSKKQALTVKLTPYLRDLRLNLKLLSPTILNCHTNIYTDWPF